MIGHDNILAGSHDIVVAGGMESMSRAPYLVLRGRTGYRIGHGDQLKDHMFYDGLEDAYEEGRAMGTFAEDCVAQYGFTREMLDAFGPIGGYNFLWAWATGRAAGIGAAARPTGDAPRAQGGAA